jgi:hypothetical protein
MEQGMGMEQGSYSGSISSLTSLESPSIKVVAWSLLRLLIGIYDSDNSVPVSVKEAEGSSDQRYSRKLLYLAKVLEAANEGDAQSKRLVEHILYRPFLDTLHAQYSIYCVRLPVPPSAFAPTSGMLGDGLKNEYYRLHTLFSALHHHFCPAVFSNNSTPITVTSALAEDYLNAIMSSLFSLCPTSQGAGTGLTRASTFETIGKNIDIFRSHTIGAFVNDRQEDGNFVIKSLVSNSLRLIIGKGALEAISEQLQFFPSALSNPLVQQQLGALNKAEFGESL